MAGKSKNSKAARAAAPKHVDSTRDLANLQRAMWGVISRPLTADNKMQPKWSDGSATSKVAATIAKPNDRLTSFERLEIYNRMYWFRILDSIYDDCPGLRAVLGDSKFIKLAEAYLVKYPSGSFTLRDLPSRLAKFIRAAPKYTKPHTALCYDLARFEWARVVVFDTASLPVFTLDGLLDVPPAKHGKLRFELQPYLQLLQLDYPVDEFLLAIKQQSAELLRGDASNAPSARRQLKDRKVQLPVRRRTFVAIHRLDSKIYFKQLEPAAYRILLALRAGKTLENALMTGIPRAQHPRTEWAAQVQGWFRTWMELGWLCKK